MQELIIILIIVVLIFGAKRIPEIMGGVAKGIKSFKSAMDTEEPPASAPPPAPSASNAPPKKEP